MWFSPSLAPLGRLVNGGLSPTLPLQPSLGPTSSAAPWGYPLLWGFEAAPVRSEKGCSKGYETHRNVWQIKCRCSTGREANRGRLFGVICLFTEESSPRNWNEQGREWEWGDTGMLRQCLPCRTQTLTPWLCSARLTAPLRFLRPAHSLLEHERGRFIRGG